MTYIPNKTQSLTAFGENTSESKHREIQVLFQYGIIPGLVRTTLTALGSVTALNGNAVDAPGSTLEYDVSRSYTVGTGEPIFGFDLAKVASDKLFVNSLSIELRPQDTLSIIADSQSVTDIKATIVMNEEF